MIILVSDRTMDLHQRNKELTIIYQEYKDFFEVIELKLTSSILADLGDGVLNKRNSHIRLRTHEGDMRQITVDLRGWSIIGSEKSYETFETLMMQISEGFRDSFGNQLTKKLNELN